MTVRTKLLLGYGSLLVLLLVTAGSAAWGFADLGRGIDRILKENFESVSASAAMMELLERQDSVTLARLLDPAAQPGQMKRLEQEFGHALGRVKANITIDEERPIIERVEAEYGRYRKSRERLIERRPERPLAAYQAGTFQRFDAVKLEVQALMDVNRRAMLEADRQARGTATASAAWLGFLVVVALLAVALLYRWLQGEVLLRLDEIRHVADAIAAGDRKRRVPERGSDELGLIGRSFNAALDHQEAVEGRMEGVLGQSRQVLLGLLGQFPGEHGLLGLDGRIVASNLGQQAEARLAEFSPRIMEIGRGATLGPVMMDTAEKVIDLRDGARGKCRLLVADGKRPVGWLVSFDQGA